jgi:hypothetical protein
MFGHRSRRRSAQVAAAVFLAAAAALATTTPAAAAVPQNLTGSGQGSIVKPFANSGTPLLSRFKYGFTNGDHPLRRLAEVPLTQQSAIELTMADKNADDNFAFDVNHLSVNPGVVPPQAFHGNCVGSCTVPLNRPAGNVVFVLTGFRFSFDFAEHPLDTIQVTESGGLLTTAFRDQNGDDPYTYDVTYAWVPASLFGVVSNINGNVQRSGRVLNLDAAVGNKVIRGFVLDNQATGDAGDNNIQDVGISADFSTIDVRYGDRNPADSADWRYFVNYATIP